MHFSPYYCDLGVLYRNMRRLREADTADQTTLTLLDH
jgi:hypothetical protein